MQTLFEWDRHKAEANLRKQGVSFEEAQTVFTDPLSITLPDPDHSEDEERFIDIGMSDNRRVLVVVYTERGQRIGLISARKATPMERKQYEEETYG
ncbi:MAG: BrnT family toxin [Anaerolineae bacterium]